MISLKPVAEETVRICEAGRYTAPSGATVELAAQLRAAVEGTRVYRPADVGSLPPASVKTKPRFEVTSEKTGDACRRLLETERVPELAALNFASAKNPGGGFLGGARAQEEDLARCSGLYFCLRDARDYYGPNRAERSMLYTDHLIYSPRVPFFRDDEYALLERPFLPSIITAPAPNAGEALKRDPGCGPAIRATLFARAEKVLAVAAAHGHRTLVLGAWGCGVFRNDPVEVADAFAAGLDRWPVFERVVFAVWERTPGENLRAFQDRFASTGAV